MSRKSRFREIAISETTKIYKTAAYVRKSLKDEESVDNQINMVRMYIDGKSDLELCKIYVDNGVSGVNFARQDFERMLADIKDGKIDCVVVKDLSRFGRDYIVGGELIEMLLPKWGVRFIAINDVYDSLEPSSQDILTMHIKNVMNRIYLYDLSEKISSVFHQKQLQGEFIGATAPYGYLKSSEKGKLIINPDTASIVKEIFSLRLTEMSFMMIAHELTSRGVLTPSQYNLSKGIISNEKRFAYTQWRADGIRKILSNQVYLGHMVQGKKRSYFLEGGQKQSTIPKEKWIIVKNTHPGIIDQETFDEVQKYNELRSIKHSLNKDIDSKTAENILKGFVYCGNCGAGTIFKKNTVQSKKTGEYKDYNSYVCYTHRNNLLYCSCKPVSEKNVLAAVFGAISAQISMAIDMKMLIQDTKNGAIVTAKKQKIEQQINQANNQFAQVKLYKESLYVDYKEKLLNKADYIYAQKRYNDKQAEINTLLVELKEQKKVISEENTWMQAFLNFRFETVLTRKMVECLIERIVIYGKTAIEVHFRFQDALSAMRNELQVNAEVSNDSI